MLQLLLDAVSHFGDLENDKLPAHSRNSSLTSCWLTAFKSVTFLPQLWDSRN